MFFPYKDDNPKILIPYVNYSIIGINILIFIFQFTTGVKDPEAEAILLYTYGLIPANFSILTMLSSMFLHGGVTHILGNMWFLWIFGDNVESTLGHARYILFYILCGIFAALCQVLMNPGSEIPMVGASGAVFGILLAFAMLFPNMELMLLFPPIPVKAKYLVLVYGIYELWSELNRMPGDNVAHFAHLGGMLIAYLILQYWKKKYGTYY